MSLSTVIVGTRSRRLRIGSSGRISIWPTWLSGTALPSDSSESCRSACSDQGGLFRHFERLSPPFEYLHGPASPVHRSEEIESVRQPRGRKAQSVVAELGRGQNAQLAYVPPSLGLPVEYGDLPALQPVPLPQSPGLFLSRGP